MSQPPLDDATFAALDALLDDGFCTCVVVTDEAGVAVDYRFLRVNRRFEAATGLRDAEGRTALELIPGLEASWVEAYGRVGLGGETLRFSQGAAPLGRVFDVLAVPAGPPGHFAVLFRDVTALRRLEEEREAALLSAQVLLKEMAHRVMNSFAAISAVTALEMRGAPAEARPALQRLQGRVGALGALYRRLDGAARADRVDAADYLGGILASLSEAVGTGIEARVASLWLPTRAAVPLGLVVNELAACGARGGAVAVELTEAGGACRLEVAAPGFDGLNEALLRAFVGELGGELALGDAAVVTFPTPA